ncbi:MAG: hypothetical protein RLZZ444_2928, partial [Pseudomonadota bacterium]
MTSYSSIAAQVASGTTAFDLADGDALVLTVDEAQTLVASGVTFAAGDAVSIADLADNVEALSESEITALGTLGVSTVLGTDAQLGLSLTQLAAFSSGGIAVSSEYATFSEVASEAPVNTATVGYQNMDETTLLSDGSYIITWRSNVSGDNEIHAQIYDADGNEVGTNLTLAETDYNFGNSGTIALADGGFAFYWAEYTSGLAAQNIYVTYHDAAGNVLTGPITVSPEPGYKMYVEGVQLDDGSLAFTWSDGSGVGHAQVVDETGALVGPDNQLATTVGYSFDGTSTCALSDGSFVTTFRAYDDDGWDIFYQIVDASGVDVGTPVQVNSYATGNQADPAITLLANGGFVIAWRGEYATDSEGVIQRVYDSAGNVLSDDIVVTTTTNDVDELTVTALTGGGFVTIWTTAVLNSGDSFASSDIQMTVSDADGDLVTGVITVNSWLTGPQASYDVTTLPDGG